MISKNCLASFNALIEQGHSIIVIEHNTDVIKSADWLIDLGPEAGDMGGNLVFAGVPKDITKVKAKLYGKVPSVACPYFSLISHRGKCPLRLRKKIRSSEQVVVRQAGKSL